MCGRMTLTRSGNEIAEYFAAAMDEMALPDPNGSTPSTGVTELDGSPLRLRHNVAPSQPILTIQPSKEAPAAFHWRQWGLIPAWSKEADRGGRLFNARSETAHEKPSFRSAWKKRRCLVVADGFYEWTPRNRGHQPYYFTAASRDLMAFAGLFEDWHGEGGEIIESCTVLTTAANEDLEGVHHRMPVILPRSRFAAWLDVGSDLDEVKAMTDSVPVGTLVRHAVSPAVNNARFDDPSCVLPLAESDEVASPQTPGRAESEQGELFDAARSKGRA